MRKLAVPCGGLGCGNGHQPLRRPSSQPSTGRTESATCDRQPCHVGGLHQFNSRQHYICREDCYRIISHLVARLVYESDNSRSGLDHPDGLGGVLGSVALLHAGDGVDDASVVKVTLVGAAGLRSRAGEPWVRKAGGGRPASGALLGRQFNPFRIYSFKNKKVENRQTR